MITISTGVLGGALIALHFLVPFLLLLQRPLKRKVKPLVSIAIFMLFIHARALGP